jgi:UDP-N-acetyl-2-amino-2-deoxyglucuronate dehydrogenase
MHKTFRFAIIGSGNISRTYFKAVGKISEASVVALVSRNRTQPDFVPENIEIASTLGEIRAIFDGVIIATPNGLHHQGAVVAAHLGKHVFTEKPLDITTTNMERMIAACRENNVKLGVAFQHRMSPDNMTLKKLIDEDAFGRIYSADFAVRCWRDQGYYDSGEWRGTWKVDGGGPFMQQACHELDLYTWFFGLPDKVYSFTNTYGHDIEVEDHGVSIFRYDSGMTGSFIASTVAFPGFPPALTLHTEKGSVILTNGRITGWHIQGMDNPSKEPQGPIHSGAASAAVADTIGHEVLLRDFISAVHDNSEPLIPGESAKLATELALRIYGKSESSVDRS